MRTSSAIVEAVCSIAKHEHNDISTSSQIRYVVKVDAGYLEGLVGYSARRAALQVMPTFILRLAELDLRPVNFSAFNLIARNQGITSRQVCETLGIQASNLVVIVNDLVKRGWVIRKPHPLDSRSIGLHSTNAGIEVMEEAEKLTSQLEDELVGQLTHQEKENLLSLLRRIYKN